MGSRGTPVKRIRSRTGGLHREENGHAGGGGDEEQTTASTINHEGGEHGPGEVPDGEDALNEELDSPAGDADCVENLGKVVRDETIARPLREEGQGDNDPHTLTIARSREERLVADIGGDGAVELDGGLDFLELVLDERVLLVTIGVIVGERLESLGITTLAHEPTG